VRIHAASSSYFKLDLSNETLDSRIADSTLDHVQSCSYNWRSTSKTGLTVKFIERKSSLCTEIRKNNLNYQIMKNNQFQESSCHFLHNPLMLYSNRKWISLNWKSCTWDSFGETYGILLFTVAGTLNVQDPAVNCMRDASDWSKSNIALWQGLKNEVDGIYSFYFDVMNWKAWFEILYMGYIHMEIQVKW